MVQQRTPVIVLILAGAILTLTGSWASAEDQGKTTLSGTWVKTDGEGKIEFADKDTMKLLPHGDKAPIAVNCKVVSCKEGRVTVKVTSLEGSEEVKERLKAFVPVDLEFSFAWQVKGNTATLEDIKGDKTEGFKGHITGKYEKK